MEERGLALKRVDRFCLP